MDISLIHVDSETGRVSLQLNPKPVKGLTKLAQVVVLSLLNTPGKDILDPDKGAGIPEMVGMNFDPADLTEVLGEVSRRVRKSETEILNDQIGLALSPQERLRELRIISVTPGAALDEVLVRIRVINELGQQSDVVL